MYHHDYPRLSEQAIKLLEASYLLPGESVDDMFFRVAEHVVSPELEYDPITHYEMSDKFYHIMRRLLFLPNSPTLMNADTPLGQLSACFVVPVGDSLESIFEAAKQAALIQKTGGGVGFDFSSVRPQDDLVRSTNRAASGPIPFIKAFSAMSEAVNQGGRRKGANMGVLRIDHPDILDFIKIKRQDGALSNFNLSVAVTDEFIEALKAGRAFPLINPRTGEIDRTVSSTELFKAIVDSAWSGGEPGLLFIDRINRANPTPEIGAITATNPCGEQPLLAYESCNLGSINLARMVTDQSRFDWPLLEWVVHLAVRFLDNVIEVNRFPLPVIERITRSNRKIGLGVMGFADMLTKLKIAYDSPSALKAANQVMGFIQAKARESSYKLGQERGSFPNFDRSTVARRWSAMRNATVTSIAPTGSISLIAGCTSGIEPPLAVTQRRLANQGGHDNSVPPFTNQQQIETLENGSKTACQISGTWQVEIQEAFQSKTDNAVSKTVNLPTDATRAVVEEVFMKAIMSRVKGLTVYRDGSRQVQIQTSQFRDNHEG